MLHERHDRPAEGRRRTRTARRVLHALGVSGEQSARPRHLGQRRDAAGRADVPRERVGLSVPRDAARARSSSTPARTSTRRACSTTSSQEKVTWSAGVPTIWLGILQLLDANPRQVGSLAHEGHARRRLGRAARDDRRVRAAPRAHDRAGLGHDRDVAGRVDGARSRTTSLEADEETRFDLMAMAGMPLPLVEIRARVGDEEIPWDGEAMGELEVRGPWVASSATTTRRSRPTAGRPTAGSRPATSSRCTRAASSRSRTARRT